MRSLEGLDNGNIEEKGTAILIEGIERLVLIFFQVVG